MPRISVKLIAERETFTNQNFQTGMSIEQANDALVQKYGMKMNPKRLKELFDASKQDLTHDVTVQSVSGLAVVSGDTVVDTDTQCLNTETVSVAVFAPSVSPMRPTSKITPEGCLPIGELVSQLEKGEYLLNNS
jgi:hypothetical protein